MKSINLVLPPHQLKETLLILETEIEDRYIKLVAWMLQLFETQLIVAVIWTMEVSQNLKIFNYSMQVTPPMMNQFLSVVEVEKEELLHLILRKVSIAEKGAMVEEGNLDRGEDVEGDRGMKGAGSVEGARGMEGAGGMERAGGVEAAGSLEGAGGMEMG